MYRFFYQMLNAVTGEREFYCSALHKDYCQADDQPEVDIHINGSKLEYKYRLGFVYHENCELPTPSDLQNLAKVNHLRLNFKILV